VRAAQTRSVQAVAGPTTPPRQRCGARLTGCSEETREGALFPYPARTARSRRICSGSPAGSGLRLGSAGLRARR
jgi:hypothetical protein